MPIDRNKNEDELSEELSAKREEWVQPTAIDLGHSSRVELAKDIYTIRSTVHNPELLLNEKWQIVGYSSSFLPLTNKVIDLAQRRASLKEFLADEDFEKILAYQQEVKRLEQLPYDEGNPWELRYEGPKPADRIGETWILSSGDDESKWDIVERDGRNRLIHTANLNDPHDCYAMYHQGFGSADEDIRLEFVTRTSSVKEHILDVSAVLSGFPGGKAHYPEITGYTICTGSDWNRLSRFQRMCVDIVSRTEELKPSTEYKIEIERTGGRLIRKLTDLTRGIETEPMTMIDPHALYDLSNFVGFTTYSGDLDIYDIKLFTRKSLFSIDQFKLTFDMDVQLRDPKLEGNVYKLKIGRDARKDISITRLLFEDITERVKIENELKSSRQQLRELALHIEWVREQERTMIAREIHDELGQDLTALQLDLHGMKKRMPEGLDDLQAKADSMLRLIDVTNRTVQRISTYLRPALLDDLGLTAAIEWQLDEFAERTGIDCELKLEANESALEEELSTAIFRIFQETLTNIARHAEATQARVSLVRQGDCLVLEVYDNGRGITTAQVENTRSFGVIGMRERIYPWGGQIDFLGEPGRGTTVKVRVGLTEDGDENDQDSDS
jgi:signal transduction histidine kinase